MGREYFRFKQFTIRQPRDVMRVNTDGVMLGAWARFDAQGRSLDVGTGTGVLALMLAQRGAAHVDAIDIERDAYVQACENAEASPWADRVQVWHSSFQQWAEQCPGGYATIVSNPPYFSRALRSLDAVRNSSRHNDMLPHADILSGLELCLEAEGRFSAIFPLVEGTAFLALAAEAGFHCNRFTSVSSRPNGPTKRILCEIGRHPTIPEKSHLSIYDAEGAYSQEYRRLTREFYLAFD